jgi:hypothetical protein
LLVLRRYREDPAVKAPPSRRGRAQPLAAAAVSLLPFVSATPAAACPRCATGQEARREVWRDDFGAHLAMTILPFAIIGVMSWRLHSIGKRP